MLRKRRKIKKKTLYNGRAPSLYTVQLLGGRSVPWRNAVESGQRQTNINEPAHMQIMCSNLNTQLLPTSGLVREASVRRSTATPNGSRCPPRR